MCNYTIDNTRFNSMIHISLLIKDEIDVLDINMRRVRIFRDIAANLFPTILSWTLLLQGQWLKTLNIQIDESCT